MPRPRSSRIRGRARPSRPSARPRPAPDLAPTVASLLEDAGVRLEQAGIETAPSASALRVARGSAARLRLEDRVTFHGGDLLEPVRALAGRVDLVVSNPPYVTDEEWERLAPEVREHDPRMALVPPEGVAALYARLIGQAREILRAGGWVAGGVGAGLGGVVLRALAAERVREVS